MWPADTVVCSEDLDGHEEGVANTLDRVADMLVFVYVGVSALSVLCVVLLFFCLCLSVYGCFRFVCVFYCFLFVCVCFILVSPAL